MDFELILSFLLINPLKLSCFLVIFFKGEFWKLQFSKLFLIHVSLQMQAVASLKYVFTLEPISSVTVCANDVTHKFF